MTMMNCPNPWPGMDGAYSRAYRILEAMAHAGHATAPSPNWKGRKGVGYSGSVSVEMREFIDALNSGEEERIKRNILEHIHHVSK